MYNILLSKDDIEKGLKTNISTEITIQYYKIIKKICRMVHE